MDYFSLHSLALILVSFYSSSLLISSASANVPVLQNKTTTDPRLALLSFKSLLSDPSNSLASWDNNGSLHYCMWQGVTCSRRHPLQVVVLDLGSLGLAGPISPIISNLTFLRRLHLPDNLLKGSIPEELGRLSRLRYLDLSKNYLTGGIPPSLGNLSSLQSLYLGRNNLEGSIPESLGSIPSLQLLSVVCNNLSNRIPSSIFNHSTIKDLWLANNMLSGRLVPDMGLTLPNLNNLALGVNQFEGRIPVSLANASGLKTFDLNNNFFDGPVPSNLGSLQNLRLLQLGWNQLQSHDWSFLSSLTNCSLLETLMLYDNNLKGPLPSSVGNLSTQLQELWIGNNPISGIIPAEIGNLVNLTVLLVDRSLLVGNIPTTIGELRNLIHLNLSGNNLIGSIPSAIGNLHRLNELSMQENNLSGTIPPSIGGCTSLSLLNLSHNALEGTIPRELLSLSSLTQYLDLSYNSLTGSIPMEVAQLINLGILSVSENQLSGDIPPALGACLHLEQLYMDGNFFQGNIPPLFISLRGLKELDLSRNNLSGQIPKFLESFGSLQSLNLSFNDFEGEVPSGGVFSNASEISVLGNNKLCGGYPKLQLPSCSVHDPARQITLLKAIIPAVGAVIILLFSLIGIIYMWRKRGHVKVTHPASSFEGEGYKKLSYADIYKVTDAFSSANLVGVGSFSSVYKGKIDSEESLIAVKVLNLHRKGASRSFTAECEALRNMRHRNLVKIVTTCSSVDYRGNDFKALVFEYMSNGSLEKWLHPEVGLEHLQPPKLTLIQRLNIAIDVASALDYLHHSCPQPVVHCDLKPSNVLLDNDMTAHVGDFGLARFLSNSTSAASENSSTTLMAIEGSIGYAAPEYGMGSQVSIKGDVYSFGVLLLEMLIGKKPTDAMFKDGLNLRRYVEMAFSDNIMKILDPQMVLRDEGEVTDSNIMIENITRERSTRCIFSLVRIGLICSNDTPSERMEMRDVVAKIRKIKELFSMVEVHGGGNIF